MYLASAFQDCLLRLSSSLTKGSLQIKESQETDQGKYECVAENRLGAEYSYSAHLYVRGNPPWKICLY